MTMRSLKSLTFFGASFFFSSTLALPEPVQPVGAQYNPAVPLVEARSNPLVNHWESIYDSTAYSLSPLSSLALLTVAGMAMPIFTGVGLGLGNLALASASPINIREEDAVNTDGPIVSITASF